MTATRPGCSSSPARWWSPPRARGTSWRPAPRARSCASARPASAPRRCSRASRWRLNRAFERTPPGRRLQIHLDGAALPLHALQAAAIALAAALAGYFVASFIVGTFASIVAAGLVVVGLSMWLERKRELRRDAFMGQLPELARILSNGASAGLSMVSAYGVAVQELDDPAQDRAADRPGGDPHRPALRARDGEPRPAPALARALGPRHHAGHPAALRRRPRARAVGHGGDARGAPRDPARGQDADGGRHRHVLRRHVHRRAGALPGRPDPARARWTAWPPARSGWPRWSSPACSSSSASCSSGGSRGSTRERRLRPARDGRSTSSP